MTEIMKKIVKWVAMAVLFVILLVCGIIISPLVAFSILAEPRDSANVSKS